MILLKKYGPIGLIYIILNILLFIFWWVVTDPGNYIWRSIDVEKEILLVSACNKLFLIKYYVYVVVCNCLLTAIAFYELKRIVRIAIVLFAAAFFFITKSLFDPYVGRNYYTIFENQKVSKNFFLEPVSDAGKSIGPFLLEKLNEKPSYSREQAAKGLGIIRYTAATEKLTRILYDSTELISMRAECFYALTKMNTPESKKELEEFSVMHNEQSGDSLLIDRINFVEMQDIY
ncbi:MAG: HEAT repeat domain-containing protein [Cytophaga sp.]|uniref:HEAT repeat domain-containing protein n=1 Tax=Cytophaga sp. TaxID=29535 RepID=UPI003F81BDFB